MVGISDRLRLVRTRLGYTQKEMAGVLEVPYRTLQDNERALVQPGAATLSAYAAIGVDLNWLITGLEHPQRASLTPPVDELAVKKNSVVVIRAFSYGTIGAAKKPTISDGSDMVVSKELLKFRGRGNSKLVGLIWVAQPDMTMAPDIPKGAKLIVDMDPIHKVQSGTYLVGHGQSSLARRLTVTEDGYIIVTTADGRVDSVVPNMDAQAIGLLGRVVYVIKPV